MKRRLPMAILLAGVASSFMPLGHAAELITLRNGFQMRCDHSLAEGDHVRLYMTGGADNYIELLSSDVVLIAQDAAPAVASPSSDAPGADHSPGSLAASGREPQTPLTHADLSEMLNQAGERHNLDVDLLASVVHAESDGNPRAVSRAGARGLMQLMPDTAASLGVADSFQPQQNIRGGSAYLDAMLTRYGNNLAMALAAYNAGPEAVDRYGGIPPYPETRAYVARVIHEFNRRVLARRVAERRAANQDLPQKLHAAVSQK
jgi:soluble lytic murein transglycosylase-like protein